MKLRSRFLAALLALVGLLTVSVNGAWAATCAADMEVECGAPSAQVATEMQSCAADVSATRTDCSGLPDGSGSSAPHCPSMPLSTANACGVVLALPAEVSLQTVLSLPEARLFPRTEHAHELLLAAAFFRPPIA